MSYYSLFFEARSIQSYIFDSGKMKEMVGASELIKQLCAAELEEAIKKLGLDEIKPDDEAISNLSCMENNQVFFPRRSGGAFSALFADKAYRDRFLGVWSMCVNTFVPGLEVVYAVADGDDEDVNNDIQKLISKTYKKLAYNRNFPPVILPEATPMHVLAPRTGKPAVENREDEASRERIWTDEASIKKLEGAELVSKSESLSEAFLGDNKDKYSFPTNLEFDTNGNCEFPFKPDSRYLGLIHADGNALGQTLLNIKENITEGPKYAVTLRLFSENLEKSTKEAAQAATEKLIEQFSKGDDYPVILPMRPLVLGGDDLTVLIRADLAMQFVVEYCKAFEVRTQENFAEIRKSHQEAIPEKLTACAGLAYVKNNQPFMDAFMLAEALCTESKKVSKALKRDIAPATVTSRVVSNSFIESYSSYKEKELTIKKGDKEYIATLGAYAIDEEENEIPTLESLRALCRELEKDGVTSASIREYATMIFGASHLADEKWRRWIEMLKKRNVFEGLKECMGKFKINNLEDSPWTENLNTPVFDALQLLSMGDIGCDEITSDEEGAENV